MKKEELIQKAYEIAVERYAAVGGHRTSIENDAGFSFVTSLLAG